MRKDFILEVQDYVNKTWTGNDEDKFKAPETLTMEDERARIIEEERLEAEEIAKQEKQEIINDLIMAAYNNAKDNLKKKSAEELSKVTGGLNLPLDFKLPF